MSQRLINIGSQPNDGSGDTLRDGADKINANFAELYQSIGARYTLPTSTPSILGGVKVDGTSIIIDINGVISAPEATYTLPTASTTVKGGVKVDGTTITINGSGVISGSNQYVLPTATPTQLGGVKVDDDTIIITNGIISVANAGATVTTGSTAPSLAELGDLWYDTADGRMYVYYDSAWVDSSPPVSDTINTTHEVVPTDTIDFANFSGQILVNDHSATGQLDLWLLGGGFASRLGTSKDSDESAIDQGTFAHNPGIDGYTWTSNLTGTVAFVATRTRTGG